MEDIGTRATSPTQLLHHHHYHHYNHYHHHNPSPQVARKLAEKDGEDENHYVIFVPSQQHEQKEQED